MDGRYIEPRAAMWAVAEVCWQDCAGTSYRAPATIEDTSRSGACLRVHQPFTVGSKVTVKWHREQFSAVTRNCRKEGRDFLLGVLRETTPVKSPAAQAKDASPQPPAEIKLALVLQDERKVMQSKTFFPHFWRRPNDGDAPAKPTSTEAPMNKPSTPNTPSGPRGELLSYEDIYRAAGIMSPGAGYGIHKVVEMMNSEHIRDLSKDVKRASVLMALDAANISADDLLTDATRRQTALSAYEAGQRKQLEDFEAVKAKENARVEEEMEKIRVHYAERIQKNLDQVAREKDALRNWQMAMQHESQRISEVIELCGKRPAPTTATAMAAAASAAGASDKPLAAHAVRPATPRPGLLGGD